MLWIQGGKSWTRTPLVLQPYSSGTPAVLHSYSNFFFLEYRESCLFPLEWLPWAAAESLRVRMRMRVKVRVRVSRVTESANALYLVTSSPTYPRRFHRHSRQTLHNSTVFTTNDNASPPPSFNGNNRTSSTFNNNRGTSSKSSNNGHALAPNKNV